MALFLIKVYNWIAVSSVFLLLFNLLLSVTAANQFYEGSICKIDNYGLLWRCVAFHECKSAVDKLIHKNIFPESCKSFKGFTPLVCCEPDNFVANKPITPTKISVLLLNNVDAGDIKPYIVWHHNTVKPFTTVSHSGAPTKIPTSTDELHYTGFDPTKHTTSKTVTGPPISSWYTTTRSTFMNAQTTALKPHDTSTENKNITHHLTSGQTYEETLLSTIRSSTQSTNTETPYTGYKETAITQLTASPTVTDNTILHGFGASRPDYMNIHTTTTSSTNKITWFTTSETKREDEATKPWDGYYSTTENKPVISQTTKPAFQYTTSGPNRVDKTTKPWYEEVSQHYTTKKTEPPTSSTLKPSTFPGANTDFTKPGSKSKQKCRQYGKYVINELDENIYDYDGDTTGEKYVTDTCYSKPTEQLLIVDGTPAIPREFPHQVNLGYQGRNSQSNIQWLCGGSLISENFVLTAAHCTNTTFLGSPRWADVGDLDIEHNNDDAQPERIAIAEIFPHPLYVYNNTRPYNDIALLRLKKNVTINGYRRPACLHTEKKIDQPTAIATGWGYTNFTTKETSSKLLKVSLDIFSSHECKKHWGVGGKLTAGIDDSSMICAGDHNGRKDSCLGDSGGPLQLRINDPYCMYSIIGVTAFGRNCGIGVPGVYTRVSNYIPWIEHIVWPN